MSATTDAITAAVLFGPGLAGTAALALTWRGAKADSAAVRQVLAESAAARAAQQQTAPPDGGEGAPTPTAEQPTRLATVLPFPTTRRAA
ncbi:hypothetical protein [Kitasatospora sp. A2-31]|uniref:hypothetical protein n=1 Tax=Kitasatospora sp. A2-31 TaxID=2916414 RepID=UPI001EECD6B2|nr:hypothetical protein [Kitasatospora sp. A2-31]MCG6494910.1 hypothetical protein [Kitasatospora sp. A2-31]